MEVGAGGGNAEHNPPPLSKKPVGDACKVYENKKGQLKTCRIGDTHWRNAVPDCVDPGFWLREFSWLRTRPILEPDRRPRGSGTATEHIA